MSCGKRPSTDVLGRKEDPHSRAARLYARSFDHSSWHNSCQLFSKHPINSLDTPLEAVLNMPRMRTGEVGLQAELRQVIPTSLRHLHQQLLRGARCGVYYGGLSTIALYSSQ